MHKRGIMPDLPDADSIAVGITSEEEMEETYSAALCC